MPARYTARMQFGPHQDSETVLREVLEVCRDGRIDEVMFFAYAEEQNDGHDPLDRIRDWMQAIRPWKKALESEHIEVSLNPWHSVLHCDRHRVLKPDEQWQNMVDWRGQAATAVVCPLDPAWRAYYVEAMRIFAAEQFRVIWVDDDIRYHNHAPLDWGGCWCPLHAAEFNRRAGTNATREEIVSKVLQPGEPHPWRTVWFDMWDELHCDLITSWRDIVEEAGTRLGLMSSALEVHSMEGRRWDRWWKAFAGDRSPIHRPHFWGYSECGSDILVYGLRLMQQNRMVQPDNVESDPEIENFPYGPWNKSFRQLFAQMSVAQVFGTDRQAVSVYDFMGNHPSDEPERAAFLSRVKSALDWLSDLFPKSMKPVGIGVPWHADMSRIIHTDGRSEDWRSLQMDTGGWDNWLAPFGFSFQKHPSTVVNALSGTMPWGFDEVTLREWLSKGLLLDGPAAAVLVERGFGDLIGLSKPRFITQADVLYSMEESVNAEFGLRPGAQMSLNAEKPYRDRLLQGDIDKGARLVSILRSPTQQHVGHGGYVFENALGGRVAVMPWDATAGQNLCTQRRAQLAKVIAWVSRRKSCGSVDGAAWLVPQFFTDGKTWRGVIWNASPDARTELAVNLPVGMTPLSHAIQCDADGVRTDATLDGNRIALARPLHQWEFVVVM